MPARPGGQLGLKLALKLLSACCSGTVMLTPPLLKAWGFRVKLNSKLFSSEKPYHPQTPTLQAAPEPPCQSGSSTRAQKAFTMCYKSMPLRSLITQIHPECQTQTLNTLITIVCSTKRVFWSQIPRCVSPPYKHMKTKEQISLAGSHPSH